MTPRTLEDMDPTEKGILTDLVANLHTKLMRDIKDYIELAQAAEIHPGDAMTGLMLCLTRITSKLAAAHFNLSPETYVRLLMKQFKKGKEESTK